MTEIKFQEIGKYRLDELTQYLFNCSDKAYRLGKKRVKDIKKDELIYLLRRRVFNSVIIKVVVDELISSKYSGYAFNHDENSEWQKDALIELILTPMIYWEDDPISFNKIAPLIKERGKADLYLDEMYIDHFLSFKQQPNFWSRDQFANYEQLIEENTASHVHMAQDMVRRFKIGMNNNRSSYLRSDNGEITTIDPSNFYDEVVSKLSCSEDLEKIMNREVTIIS